MSPDRKKVNCVLVFRAYLWLIAVQFILSARGFTALHERVARQKCRQKPQAELGVLTRSFLAAQCLYVTQIRCLHSSAACVLFLRAAGFPARLKFGVQQYPFSAHAWVELDGEVVTGTDEPGMYAVIDSV